MKPATATTTTNWDQIGEDFRAALRTQRIEREETERQMVKTSRRLWWARLLGRDERVRELVREREALHRRYIATYQQPPAYQ